jgi:pimeloyl-ACP methyl ester carboxylesterase
VETAGLDPGEGVETFLLIHGYGASTFTWRHWAPRLATRGHVVQIDMKGHGRAPKPDDARYAPRDQAELVRALIEQRDLRNLTLVGHSLGGGVALLTALGLLDAGIPRLERMVLVAGAAYAQALPPFVGLAGYPRLCSMMFRALGPELVVRAVLRAIVHDRATIDADQVRGYAGPLGSAPAVHALVASARQIVPPDLGELTARYPELDTPTLLLWGRHDRVVPLSVGERLARALPNVRLHVLERCGHLPPEELPDDSFAIVERFLDGAI